jgi:hypothetical protein
MQPAVVAPAGSSGDPVETPPRGYLIRMSTTQDYPDLRSVIEPHGTPHPDRREQAQAGPRPDDGELRRRTRLARDEVDADRRKSSS